MKTKLFLVAAGVAVVGLTGCAGMPGSQTFGGANAVAFDPNAHGDVRITQRGKITQVEATTVEVNANGVSKSMLSSAHNLANDQVVEHGGYGGGIGGAVGSVASSVIGGATSMFSDRMRQRPGVRLTVDAEQTGLETISQLGSVSDFAVGQRVMLRHYQDGVVHVAEL